MEANEAEAEGGMKTDCRRFPTQTLFSITCSPPSFGEMYPYTQLHLGGVRTVAIAGPHFLVLGSEYVLVSNF